jgi:hypothetical protein
MYVPERRGIYDHIEIDSQAYSFKKKSLEIEYIVIVFRLT